MGIGIKAHRSGGGGIALLEKLTADATAAPANIDKDKTAYVNGVKITGTSTKVDTSGATATAADILSGKTAFVNGAMLTGSLVKGKNVKIGMTSATYGGVTISGIGFKPKGFMICAQETYSNTVDQKVLCVFDDSGKNNSSKDIYYVNYNNRYSTIDVSIAYYDNSVEIYASGVWPQIDWAYVVWGE